MSAVGLGPREARHWLETELGRLGYDRKRPEYTEDGRHFRPVLGTPGWCMVIWAPPETWPPGALACWRVVWHPAAEFSRDSRKEVPKGAAGHWEESTAAVLAALRSLGLQAAVTGPHRGSERFGSRAFLAWELPPGAVADWPPAGAWDGVPPTRPNFIDGWPQWAEGPAPGDEVAGALRAVAERRRGAGVADIGRRSVLDTDSPLWPPGAHMSAHVTWWPDPEFARAYGEPLPPAAAEHWRAGVGQLLGDLAAIGRYQFRTAWEHPGARHDGAGVIVWRGPSRPS
ncbi:MULTISPECIES: hypothetical protein [Kitasatospora]|uniref:Uncharacterized protein n=1 Tax=Kitasatospora setae (strain ATCC 33774 / DSM 43861 / JCM 3304 / KCC A-0304 / NBRC 14216 / KM-6054) TaxID=452652 RepID=E4NG46_KITSK|nr:MULTISPECIES: hypothetical protein [Kitasatospora]BAJ30476.1 hypothetical protein KSE_46950 [Kitasatospora setae KM-6054]